LIHKKNVNNVCVFGILSDHIMEKIRSCPQKKLSFFNLLDLKKKLKYKKNVSPIRKKTLYLTEFAGSTQNPKKLSEHQIYQSGRTFFQKKVCLVP
jgi:hypothetical protein